MSRPALMGIGAAGALALLAQSALAQPLMLHGVRVDQLSTLLRRLDGTFGDRYSIVTPSEYTTFLYLRFVHPQRAVYTVFTPKPPNHRDPHAWAAFQQRYYGPRAVQDLGSLRMLGEPIVYIAPESNLTVANLRALMKHVPKSRIREIAENALVRMNPGKPEEMSWVWNDSEIELRALDRAGPYVAMEVDLHSRAHRLYSRRGAACP